uniref:Uncharacterized protein n=1 Tax=Anguilla anguilla TaxID=7936 RepID=A0A0E9XKW0_ANGAN
MQSSFLKWYKPFPCPEMNAVKDEDGRCNCNCFNNIFWCFWVLVFKFRMWNWIRL